MKHGSRFSTFLDMVRWLSASLVVVFHVRGAILVHWEDVQVRTPWMYVIYFASTIGHEAVMVFFVLSGFLVGGSVLSARSNGTLDLKAYAVNRISRLYAVLPAALLVGGLLDAAGVAWLRYPPIPAMGSMPAHSVEDKLGIGTAIGNLLNLQTILVPPLGTNGVLWSLANEFWYYVLFPLAVIAWDRQQSRLRRIASGFIFVLIFCFITPAMRLYFGIWLLGVVVVLLKRPLIRSPLVSTAFVALAFAIAVALPRLSITQAWLPDVWAMNFPGDLAIGIAFANLLLTMKCRRDERPPRFAQAHAEMAGFSYSLYLAHAPLLYFVSTLYQRLVPPSWSRVLPSGRGLLIFMAFIALLYIYSYAFSLVTERYSAALRRALHKALRLGRVPRAITDESAAGVSSAPR